MSKFILFLSMVALFFCSCHHKTEDLEPQINYTIQDKYLKQLPSPFKPLTNNEKQQDWGREYQIGIAFAKQLDLYLALTSFKRAEVLIPQEESSRLLEIQYDILLCYYLGQKYQDAAYTFENSQLPYVNETFPALHDLLIIMYDVYQKLDRIPEKENMMKIIKQYYPDAAKELEVSSAILKADIPQIESLAKNPDTNYLEPLVDDYNLKKKSPNKAKLLNAVLPGAGYLYIKQPQSALTAFLLNGLFIVAAYECFEHKHVAAGIIVTSFEVGWYMGGIYGAGIEATFYNKRIYENLATPIMNDRKLFPIFMLRYSF